jgi:hypothetical protein
MGRSMAHIAHQPGAVCLESGVSRWLVGVVGLGVELHQRPQAARGALLHFEWLSKTRGERVPTTRRMCACGSSSRLASPSSSSLLSSPGRFSIRWSGGDLFFFLLQSVHWRFLGPASCPGVEAILPSRKNGRGCLWVVGRDRGRRTPARGAARSRRLAGGGGLGLAPAVPRRGTPRKKWPVSLGCRGLRGPLDGTWGRKNVPRDNGRKFRGARLFSGPKAHGKPLNKEAGNPTETTPLSASSPRSGYHNGAMPPA